MKALIKKSIAFEPSESLVDTVFSSIEQHGGDNHYKLTYFFQSNNVVEFSYQRENAFNTLSVLLDGVEQSLTNKDTESIIADLKRYQSIFHPKHKEHSGNYICC